MACFTPNQGYENSRLTKNGKHQFTAQRSRARTINGQPVTMTTICHKCEGCRNDYAREWSVKIMHEASLYYDPETNLSNTSFITLTYDDDHIPAYGALSYEEHWTNFLKRLRLRLSDDFNVKIRYYMIGEYGDLNLRPHYHCIIFGWDFPDREFHKDSNGNPLYRSSLLEELWTVPKKQGYQNEGSSYGYSSVGDVSVPVAAYVARYSMKKQTPKGFDGIEEYYTDDGEILTRSKPQTRYVRYHRETGDKIIVPTEHALMSKRPGIAKLWFDEHWSDVYVQTDIPHLQDSYISKDDIHLEGKLYRPPKYYDKLLERIEPVLLDAVKKSRQDSISAHADEFTPERLVVKRKCFLSKIKNLKRNIGNVYETTYV